MSAVVMCGTVDFDALLILVSANDDDDAQTNDARKCTWPTVTRAKSHGHGLLLC